MLKNLNFGARGWLLLVYQTLAFVAFTVFSNWPMNVLADLYGGTTKLSTLYTSGAVIAIIIQLILAMFIGKLKSVKRFGAIIGAIAMIFIVAIMFVPPTMQQVWQVCYFVECIFGPMWATFAIGTLVGQWFPTKKGTFMGIATLAFPIVNGLTGAFAASVFAGGMPNPTKAFMPYFVICLIGFLIGVFVIRDYPEQCGCYRDNNKNMTPEMAKQMLEEEIENKKTSLWRTGGCFASRDYWLVTIPAGFLLMFSVGTMTQTSSIIGAYGEAMDPYGGFAGVMVMIMIFGVLGSFILGLIDSAIGTKKAMIIACIVMLLSGVFGMQKGAFTTVIALVLLAVFMGASSNFTVSVAAQYWRREDFSSVFSVINPVANLLSAIGPMIIAITMVKNGTFGVFGIIMVAGIIGVILMLLFSPKNIKKVDDKRRERAGKVIDDALVGRK